MDLRELQQQFGRMLEGDAEALKSLACGIEERGDLEPERWLQIYLNNVRVNLVEALKHHYPVIEALLGESYFSRLASSFVERHQLERCTLNMYGLEFSTFVAQLIRERPELEQLPYLADVARLEWCWHELFYEAENTPLSIEDLQILSHTPQLKEVIAPIAALRLLSLEYNADEIWLFHHNAAQEDSIAWLQSKPRLVVWRAHNERQLLRLDADDFHFLNFCSQGLSLEQLLDQTIFSKHPDRLQHCLARAVTNGWLTSKCKF